MSFLKILESMVARENKLYYQMSKTEERGI